MRRLAGRGRSGGAGERQLSGALDRLQARADALQVVGTVALREARGGGGR
ncbi:hypothetical protein ACFS3C_12090 [Azotobacter vinelandii]